MQGIHHATLTNLNHLCVVDGQTRVHYAQLMRFLEQNLACGKSSFSLVSTTTREALSEQTQVDR